MLLCHVGARKLEFYSYIYCVCVSMSMYMYIGGVYLQALVKVLTSFKRIHKMIQAIN